MHTSYTLLIIIALSLIITTYLISRLRPIRTAKLRSTLFLLATLIATICTFALALFSMDPILIIVALALTFLTAIQAITLIRHLIQ